MSERLLCDINEFCDVAHIPRSLFYALQRKGTGPRVTRLGDRSFVSVDEARNWIEQMTVPSGSRQPEAVAA